MPKFKTFLPKGDDIRFEIERFSRIQLDDNVTKEKASREIKRILGSITDDREDQILAKSKCISSKNSGSSFSWLIAAGIGFLAFIIGKKAQ